MSANMSVYKAMNNIDSNNSSVNSITITDNKPTSSSETGYSNAVRTTTCPTSGIENELANLSMSNKMSNEYNADLMTTAYNGNTRVWWLMSEK